jgi:hypothetical protein
MFTILFDKEIEKITKHIVFFIFFSFSIKLSTKTKNAFKISSRKSN